MDQERIYYYESFMVRIGLPRSLWLNIAKWSIVQALAPVSLYAIFALFLMLQQDTPLSYVLKGAAMIVPLSLFAYLLRNFASSEILYNVPLRQVTVCAHGSTCCVYSSDGVGWTEVQAEPKMVALNFSASFFGRSEVLIPKDHPMVRALFESVVS